MTRHFSQLNSADIILAARRLVRSHGVNEFAFLDVAGQLKCSVGDILNFFPDMTSLLLGVKENVLSDLDYSLHNSVLGCDSAIQKIFALCKAYRQFALKQPQLFRLLHLPELKIGDYADEQEVCDPIVNLIAEVSGEKDAIAASRFLASFMYGFCTMEIDGSFRLKGSIDEAFDYSVRSYVSGLTLSGH